ncbi:MAG: hypothetical protein K2P78_06585 [Gemmataceae bacterium]|nr:hypothetical protein [Gemmataceae bacterium]
MSTSFASGTTGDREAIRRLFAEKPPVLVEVRLSNAGTSPDWFLCQSKDDLEPILNRLGPGAVVRLSSVWDLRNANGTVVVKK